VTGPPLAPPDLLRATLDAAVAAVHPRHCLPPHVPPPGRGRTVVVGAGKAAAAMAAALAGAHRGPLAGVVVTRHGHGPPAGRGPAGIEVLEAGHPVPDAASLAAAARVRACLAGLGPEDRVIALVSGGGSALLAAPAPGLGLADEQAVTRQLLAAGATIAEVNCVRKKLSAMKGGRLAVAARPAEVLLLVISDVPGDDVADVASGPFSADVSTLADARAVLARHGCDPGPRVRRFLEDPAHETPKPGDPALARVTTRVCARSADALAAAAAVLRAAGREALLLDDRVNGPARELAAEHAALVRARAGAGRPVALVTGGETTVRVAHPAGRGGRNTEYLLALALALEGGPGAWALAADTDGIDGTEHNAGALLAPDSLARAAARGLEPRGLLARSCAFDFFAALGDLVVTGPTGTNANDLRVVLAG
jgi:hydroxypyruvate reductase